MKHKRTGPLGGLLLVGLLSSSGQGQDTKAKTLVEWTFGEGPGWAGWSANGQIRASRFEPGLVRFETGSDDPQLLSPVFELKSTSNQQWVEIDLDAAGPGAGELFYTNTTTGRYGGLDQKWSTPLAIAASGPQVLTAWPFWGRLGRIVRLRFDPPDGSMLRLRAIRIVGLEAPASDPRWSFGDGNDAWRSMYAAKLERSATGLKLTAQRPAALIITPVIPFDASARSMLRLKVRSSDDRFVGFHWAGQDQDGLYGEPIALPAGEADVSMDLRSFPQWTGTITHLALSFGSAEGSKFTLREMAVEANEPAKPFVRARRFSFDRPINRAGNRALLHIALEHAGGPPAPPGRATLTTDERCTPDEPSLPVPMISKGQQVVLTRRLLLNSAGETTITLSWSGQSIARTLRVDEPLREGQAQTRPADGYDVPPPRPVRTAYQIGVYYFPGWSPDQMNRWELQEDYPEREPVLGWYAEGKPEVADWHIKWAIENGLSFFIYDWYWRDGKENLTAGLNDGFLKARYRDQFKFALMWANHPPFADHSPEQLLAVTDYWLEHYFRRSNYLTIDGQPYVSFFAPGQLLSGLGSEEKVRATFEAMRRRVREAGLAGLHIAACGGAEPAAAELFKRCGFDSITAYNYVRTVGVTRQSAYRAYLAGHVDIWRAMDSAVLPYTPLLTVNWDARPWHGPRTEQRFARNTADFAECLQRLKSHLDERKQRVAILEAWNEWGEGSFLEPNASFGFKDLEAIREVFCEPGAWPLNLGPADVGLDGRYDLRRSRR